MFKFHHIGYASKDVKQDLKHFESLGYHQEGEVFIDEKQKIKGVFMVSINSPRVELVENINEFGPLNSLLERGIKLYHFAYSVDNLNEAVKYICKEYRAKIIVPIVNAIAFKRLSFLMMPNMLW